MDPIDTNEAANPQPADYPGWGRIPMPEAASEPPPAEPEFGGEPNPNAVALQPESVTIPTAVLAVQRPTLVDLHLLEADIVDRPTFHASLARLADYSDALDAHIARLRGQLAALAEVNAQLHQVVPKLDLCDPQSTKGS